MIVLDPDLDSDLSPGTKLQRSAHPHRPNSIPSARTLARFLREAQAAVKLRGQVTVLLTTDGEIRRLNRRFRGKNRATDVLSFPAYSPVPKGEGPLRQAQGKLRAPTGLKIAGDLAISVHTARRQAEAQGHPLAAEIKVLMLHGLLHLAGYDHETDGGEMARRELKLRERLRLPQGLIERTESTKARASSSPTHSAKRTRNGWGTRPQGLIERSVRA